MKKYSKKWRHIDAQRAKEFQGNFNGLRTYPAICTEVNISVSDSEISSSFNPVGFTLPELTDVTPLKQMQWTVTESKQSATTAPTAPAAPVAPAPTEQPKRKFNWGWVAAIFLGGSAVTYGIVRLCKKTA